MFGMLDYRAHKLYLLLFGIPLFILRWLFIVGIPFASFAVGKSYATSWVGIFLLSIAAYLVVSLISQILVSLLGKFIEFAFSLFVDIIPDDGRTKEEAKLVTWGGERTIALLTLGNTQPKDWTDEMLENVIKGFFLSLYREQILLRLDFIREYQLNNPEWASNEWATKLLLKDNNKSIPITENIICNPMYRGWVIGGVIFLYLILVQPSL